MDDEYRREPLRVSTIFVMVPSHQVLRLVIHSFVLSMADGRDLPILDGRHVARAVDDEHKREQVQEAVPIQLQLMDEPHVVEIQPQMNRGLVILRHVQ